MDEIDPRRTHFIHEPLIGENLERETAWENRPFFATPRESLLMIAVILIAIGAALYAANAAAGMPA